MHSIEFIRKNPEEFDRKLERRGIFNSSKQILVADEVCRKFTQELQALQKIRNENSSAIAQLKDKSGKEFNALKEEVKKINEKIEIISQKEKEATDALEQLLQKIPNLLTDDVPPGDTDEANVIVETYAMARKFSFTPKPHFELGEALGMMDFAQTAKIAGSRFVTLKEDLAKLERALGRFMLDIHTKESNFKEISPPLVVLPSAM